MIRVLPALAFALSVAASAAAQPPLPSPYREQLASAIRGLSEGEIEELREGRGMGLARAAELHGYPGPRHVLDAVEAGQLHLNPEQLRTVRQLFERMSGEARRLGGAILTEEQALEAAFRTGAIEEGALRARVGRIAALRGELRAVHLRAHLEARALLTDQQIERYRQLRGYTREGDRHPGRH